MRVLEKKRRIDASNEKRESDSDNELEKLVGSLVIEEHNTLETQILPQSHSPVSPQLEGTLNLNPPKKVRRGRRRNRAIIPFRPSNGISKELTNRSPRYMQAPLPIVDHRQSATQKFPKMRLAYRDPSVGSLTPSGAVRPQPTQFVKTDVKAPGIISPTFSPRSTSISSGESTPRIPGFRNTGARAVSLSPLRQVESKSAKLVLKPSVVAWAPSCRSSSITRFEKYRKFQTGSLLKQKK